MTGKNNEIPNPLPCFIDTQSMPRFVALGVVPVAVAIVAIGPLVSTVS